MWEKELMQFSFLHIHLDSSYYISYDAINTSVADIASWNKGLKK